MRPAGSHLFVYRIDDRTKWDAQARLDGSEHPARMHGVPEWVDFRSAKLHTIRKALEGLLKALARAVYVSPLLLLLRLILRSAYPAAGDVPILLFVAIVVLFFTALDLWIFVSLVWWLAGHTEGGLRFLVPDREVVPPTNALPPGRAGPGDVVHVRGKIVQLGPEKPETDVVLRDLWCPDTDPPIRVVVAHDFAIAPEGTTPVVVRLEQAPLVHASAQEGGLESFELPPPDHGTTGTGSLRVLRAGDEVEVWGRVARSIPNVGRFELGGRVRSLGEDADGGSPYRESAPRPGIVVGAEGPVRIREI